MAGVFSDSNNRKTRVESIIRVIRVIRAIWVIVRGTENGFNRIIMKIERTGY